MNPIDQPGGPPDLAREPHEEPTNGSMDPHRFAAEPPVRKSRRVAQVSFVFLCVMALIGGGTWLAKRYIHASTADREAAKREKERLAKTEAARKGKVFVFDAKDSAPAQEPAPTSNLPRAFGSNGGETAQAIPRRGEIASPGSAPGTPPAAAMPINSGGTAKAPAAVHATMMVDGPAATDRPSVIGSAGTGSAPAAEAAATRPPAPIASMAPDPTLGVGVAGGMPLSGTAPRAASATIPAHGVGRQTVQDFARLQAARSPITGTAQVSAANLGDRSMLLARGAFIPCILETQLFSTVPGESSCLVPDDVYSDDGTTLLIEKGSKVSGTYGSTMKVGDSRIAIVWNRIKTTTGVVIDVESPASDGIGVMGVDGNLDNHWPERIGAALLLSLIEDAVSIEVAKQGSTTATQGTSTTGTAKTMSEKVLESTINIPPTLTKPRGSRLAIFVKRDLWFDGVYALSKR